MPLYNLKKREKHPWKRVNFSKVAGKCNIPPWVFSRFLNCTNGYKLRKASHMCDALHDLVPFVQFKKRE